MAYRNGTYVAFDALGETQPTKSDFKYYTIISAWSSLDKTFRFVNSHEKTYAVRDTSLLPTLKSRINERLSKSKNCLIILSHNTRKFGSLLSYEVERAVDFYKIPLIITYVDFYKVMSPSAENTSCRWPDALRVRIENYTANAIHIPFKKYAILDAIEQFTVHNNNLFGPLNFYSFNAHTELDCI